MVNQNSSSTISSHSSSFKNKVVVITGGAGGLGKALGKQLLELGAKIAALDLYVEGLLASDNLLPVSVDLTNQEALQKAVEQVTSHFGGVDILINNAGITHMSKFEDTTESLFNTIMAVNFTASVDITRLCLPSLKARKGQIVAISSVAGFAPLYGRSAYSASKHAMEGFFQSLASEVIDDGIHVTIVSPSFVKSRPELMAQVNNGVSSPGAMKKSTNGEQLSPEYAAQQIISALIKKQSNLRLGRVSKIAYWLHTLLPARYVQIMSKNAKKEFQ
ncbi:SDR family oxidoreductase [Paraneptunicella aestuarii]|uniref:SDR family oxidoreductase n=1 Tax=Paraneptunicella aestuarii TaxID=2831148 RepID=UPI001E5183CD|nr:SDR family oxidoreductase [Paraneptunicella aestuarii]UAA40036.1 SDR family oxidoreductase [Paraneptunicella aestuarii]